MNTVCVMFGGLLGRPGQVPKPFPGSWMTTITSRLQQPMLLEGVYGGGVKLGKT